MQIPSYAMQSMFHIERHDSSQVIAQDYGSPLNWAATTL